MNSSSLQEKLIIKLKKKTTRIFVSISITSRLETLNLTPSTYLIILNEQFCIYIYCVNIYLFIYLGI